MNFSMEMILLDIFENVYSNVRETMNLIRFKIQFHIYQKELFDKIDDVYLFEYIEKESIGNEWRIFGTVGQEWFTQE